MDLALTFALRCANLKRLSDKIPTVQNLEGELAPISLLYTIYGVYSAVVW